MPDLSVILCTHNPRREILARALDHLAAQTLDTSRWELILVDNASSPPVELSELNKYSNLPIKIEREPNPGLTPARRKGISASSGAIVVLVDDDNFLDSDYLQNAIEVASARPELGAFGGITRAKLERPATWWKSPMLPYLGVRDYGAEEITSSADEWGKWEPIGAGMVVRRLVLEKFLEFTGAETLGRASGALLSGEDSLIARSAYRLGLACSYQPRLRLDHFIPPSRLRSKYLFRLLHGHGRSFVILHKILGKPLAPLGRLELLARLPFRILKHGPCGALIWGWDVGYFSERRNSNSRMSNIK